MPDVSYGEWCSSGVVQQPGAGHKEDLMAKNWIAGATKDKGVLHRHLGVPAGEKIPASKLAKATRSSNPTIRKEANLAKTLKSLHRKAR